MPVQFWGNNPRFMSTRVVKAYAVPLVLLCLFVFFQLVMLPRSFPHSHYDVLGVGRHASIEEVEEAYRKLDSAWKSGAEVPSATRFIKVRYAYELLTNPLWKRDYDTFGIDEHIHVLQQAKLHYEGDNFINIKLPLLEADNWGLFDIFIYTLSYANRFLLVEVDNEEMNVLSSENWTSVLSNSNSWIILMYSRGSKKCFQFYGSWRRIAYLLEGVANSSTVELGDTRLSMFLAERKPAGNLFFRNGVPAIIIIPEGCQRSDCVIRYSGNMTIDAVTDWFSTSVLSLPRILYYSKESLAKKFLSESAHHKIKVIFFSETGQRATPFVRFMAKKYWAYASFAYIFWRDEDISFWWNSLEVDSAPAIVFIKDPGSKPIVIEGPVDSSSFAKLMEQHKQQELAQLRSVTSADLGCDARGHSRAGNDTSSWYCVVLAGRVGPELTRMRQTIIRLQKELLEGKHETHAANALAAKRLTFTWLDGEVQEKYCLFYLHSETSYETCGARRGSDDVPKLFLVRYKKSSLVNVPDDEKNVWSVLMEEEKDPVSQLVARYNGSDEAAQIMNWISDIILDGDTKELPLFRARTPDLIPEDSEPTWRSPFHTRRYLEDFRLRLWDYVEDPRVGPWLLMAALMWLGALWLIRRHPSDEDHHPRGANRQSPTVPPSLTDVDPVGAYQMPLSDSDDDSP